MLLIVTHLECWGRTAARGGGNTGKVGSGCFSLLAVSLPLFAFLHSSLSSSEELDSSSLRRPSFSCVCVCECVCVCVCGEGHSYKRKSTESFLC